MGRHGLRFRGGRSPDVAELCLVDVDERHRAVRPVAVAQFSGNAIDLIPPV